MDIFYKIFLDFCTIIGGFSALVFVYEKIKKLKRNIKVEYIDNQTINKSNFKAIEKSNIHKNKLMSIIISLLAGLFYGILLLLTDWNILYALIPIILPIIEIYYIDKIIINEEYSEAIMQVSYVSYILWFIFFVIKYEFGYSMNVNILFIINLLLSCYIGFNPNKIFR